jgi:hypothetical protein
MSSEQLLQQFFVIILTLIASQGFWNMMLSRFTRSGKIERAIKALLHDKISHLAMQHITAGSITAEEYRVIVELHEAYIDVGGNGTIARLMLEVQKLKIEMKE